jgi:ribonuclease P protein component
MQQRFRLRRSADFKRVQEQGRSWRHPLAILSIAPNDLPHNRYGFITAKRIGHAVLRNRVRRLLREAVREMERESPLRTSYDCVIIARNPIAEQAYNKKAYKVVQQALEELFRRARLWASE